jgi:hypothetical protein
MSTVEAPSFERARLELYQLLSSWSFVRVVRPCVQGDNGYFHGTGVKDDGARVWFQKMRGDVSGEEGRIGPLLLKTHPDVMPRPGDVLMGKSVPTNQRSDKLLFYFTYASHVEKLKVLVEQGTAQTEAQLAHELRARKPVNGGVDDAWALARLVLFGNVKAFAEQHRGKPATMRLSCDPLTFVHTCAIDLDDPSIWDAFVTLVPDAVPPVPPPPPQPIVKPLNLQAAALFVGRRRAPPSPPKSPPFYDYMKRTRAESPPYKPQSPPFYDYSGKGGGESPPYNPATPPYSPRQGGMEEPYSPSSPGFYNLPPPLPQSPPPPPPPPATTYTVESVLSLLQSVHAVQAQQGAGGGH